MINTFRSRPHEFASVHGWRAACTRPLTISYDPLIVLPELEDSASFQANTVLECPPPSHTTCRKYCHLFGGSCSYIDRINHFVPDASNQQEVLVYGPKHPMKWLVQSRPHCDHILNPNITHMGGATHCPVPLLPTVAPGVHPLFILSMILLS